MTGDIQPETLSVQISLVVNSHDGNEKCKDNTEPVQK